MVLIRELRAEVVRLRTMLSHHSVSNAVGRLSETVTRPDLPFLNVLGVCLDSAGGENRFDHS